MLGGGPSALSGGGGLMSRHLFLACVSGILLAVTAGAYGERIPRLWPGMSPRAHARDPKFAIGQTGKGPPAEGGMGAPPTETGGGAIPKPTTKKRNYPSKQPSPHLE